MNDVVLLHSKKRLHDSKNDIIIGVEVGKARGICILLRNVGRKVLSGGSFPTHGLNTGVAEIFKWLRGDKML